MHNQRIFNASFRHFGAEEIKAGARHQAWELNEPSYLVMICHCYDGGGFIRQVPKPPELWGWTLSDFLDHDGHASSIVCLIFNGVMRYVDDQWAILAGCLQVPLGENADLGIVSRSVPSDMVVQNVAAYIRTHRHSRMTWPTIFAGQRTSDQTN